MTDNIDNYADVIDSREVTERIDELTATLEADDVPDHDLSDGARAVRDADREELDMLTALAREGESATSDWPHGATLIRDSYFEDYAREMAEDLGLINPEMGWPYGCIDWEQAAKELQVDYTSVDYDGVTYWTR